MTDALLKTATHDIVVDEVFPHAPSVLWKVLTSGELMARWMMEPQGFAPVAGTKFTFQTTPAGAWDGKIRCQVLDVKENERFSYSWQGGDEGNSGAHQDLARDSVGHGEPHSSFGTPLRGPGISVAWRYGASLHRTHP